MNNAELAARLAALDWSATSLQHQIAISAAVATLSGKPLPVPYPYQPGDPRFDGADAFECYQTRDLPDNVIDLREIFRRELQT